MPCVTLPRERDATQKLVIAERLSHASRLSLPSKPAGHAEPLSPIEHVIVNPPDRILLTQDSMALCSRSLVTSATVISVPLVQTSISPRFPTTTPAAAESLLLRRSFKMGGKHPMQSPPPLFVPARQKPPSIRSRPQGTVLAHQSTHLPPKAWARVFLVFLRMTPSFTIFFGWPETL